MWAFSIQDVPSGEWLDIDAPLSGVTITRSLGAAMSVTGSLPVEVPHLRGRLREWGTAIYVTHGDTLRAGGIIPGGGVEYSGQSVAISAVGPSSWLHEQPYLPAPRAYVDADPATIHADIWSTMQAWAGGFLGVTVDPLTTPMRVGVAEDDEDDDSGPYRLAWWTMADVGSDADTLLEEARIDWREEVSWGGGAGRDPRWRIRRAHPRLGVRRDVYLTVGSEIVDVPPMQFDEYASDVLVIGAGEGSAQVRADASLPTTRLRRAVAIPAKGIGRTPTAQARARTEVARRTGTALVSSILTQETPTFDPWSIDPGDEIHIGGDAGWIDLNHWVRVVEISTDIDSQRTTLEVTPA